VDRLRREDGAVAVLVALLLPVIMAMVVLAVDVGALETHRRAMVNTADSAALAAAQSCIDPVTYGDPETLADQYAAQNESGSQGGIVWNDTVNCGTGQAGHVTVLYTAPHEYFFAPVLGFPSTGTIEATATAEWGPTSEIGPIPLVLDLGSINATCDVPNIQEGTVCYFWYDNDKFSGSNWGFLNLDLWDVDATAACPNRGGANELAGYLDGSLSFRGGLNYPLPTYVCRIPGLTDNLWFNQIASLVAQQAQRDFPINDPSGQLTLPSGVIDKFDIIGFAHMQFWGIWRANDAPAACQGVRPATQPSAPGAGPGGGGGQGNNSGYCLALKWNGAQIGGTPGGAADFGLYGVRLIR
jgi:hypothetical protein